MASRRRLTVDHRATLQQRELGGKFVLVAVAVEIAELGEFNHGRLLGGHGIDEQRAGGAEVLVDPVAVAGGESCLDAGSHAPFLNAAGQNSQMPA